MRAILAAFAPPLAEVRLVRSITFCLLATLVALTAPASVQASAEYAFHFDSIHFDGAWARALDDGLGGEFAVRRDTGAWRPGVAVLFASHDMPAPDADATWSHIAVFGTLRARPWTLGRIAPFVEGRAGWVRMRPESDLFLEDPDRELEPGENPFDARNGLELSLIGGVGVQVVHGVGLEVGGLVGWLRTQEADLSPVGKDDVATGVRWGLRLGVVWSR